MANSYEEGDAPTVEGKFYSDPPTNTVLHDPSVVKLDVDAPDNTQTTYTYPTDSEITKQAVGHYTAVLDTSGKPGRWFYRWYSTGTGQAADQASFHVNPKRKP